MLMRFSVSNFMSFGSKEDDIGKIIPTEYHLYAGRSEQHKDRVISYKERKVLKFSAIYGANASGKTNLVRAIDVGKKIILNTMDGVDFHGKFCKSNNDNVNKPTLFEYEFTIGERCFAYGFTVNLESHIILGTLPLFLRGNPTITVVLNILFGSSFLNFVIKFRIVCPLL